MIIKSVTPILNVSSVLESMTWFEALGWRRGFEWAGDGGEVDFGSVCTDGAEIFLCRDGQGSRGTIMPRFPGDDMTDGVWMSWWVESPAAVDALYAEVKRLGFTATCEPGDRSWSVREFHLRHPDGHMFRVSAGLGEE